MVTLAVRNSQTQIIGRFSEDDDVNEAAHKSIKEALSYEVKDAGYSAEFKEGRWDGTISLYKRREMKFPTGLVFHVISLLKELQIPYKIKDYRVKPNKRLGIKTRFAEFGRELRFYQDAAAAKAEEKGRGIISIATGGGKTVIACDILRRFAVYPVIFIVPSKSLLEQSHAEFLKYLSVDDETPHIGMAGDGICDINMEGINVVTYQTLLAAYDEKYQEKATRDPKTGKKIAGNTIVKQANCGDQDERKSLIELQAELEAAEKAFKRATSQCKSRQDVVRAEVEKLPEKQKQKKLNALEREINKLVSKEKKAFTAAREAVNRRLQSIENKKLIRQLVEKSEAMIVDEAHMAAVIIEAIGEKALNAYYRIGLTATPFREDNQQIRVEGTLGRKMIEISASDLIELGYLVPARIFMVRIDHLEYAQTYHEAYAKHITNCWERNYRIKQFAETFKEEGRPVLILVEKKDHGQVLESMIRDSVFVAGSDDEKDPTEEEKSYRRRVLNATEKNEVILIATQWANVGVDAPRLSVLILAGSGQSAVTTYQQVGRILRPVGKDYADSCLNGKHEAVIIDFMDEHKKMHEHSVRRRKVYRRERAWKVKVV